MVTVMLVPVHGFTSGNTSSNMTVAGGSADAGSGDRERDNAEQSDNKSHLDLLARRAMWTPILSRRFKRYKCSMTDRLTHDRPDRPIA